MSDLNGVSKLKWVHWKPWLFFFKNSKNILMYCSCTMMEFSKLAHSKYYRAKHYSLNLKSPQQRIVFRTWSSRLWDCFGIVRLLRRCLADKKRSLGWASKDEELGVWFHLSLFSGLHYVKILPICIPTVPDWAIVPCLSDCQYKNTCLFWEQQNHSVFVLYLVWVARVTQWPPVTLSHFVLWIWRMKFNDHRGHVLERSILFWRERGRGSGRGRGRRGGGEGEREIWEAEEKDAIECHSLEVDIGFPGWRKLGISWSIPQQVLRCLGASVILSAWFSGLVYSFREKEQRRTQTSLSYIPSWSLAMAEAETFLLKLCWKPWPVVMTKLHFQLVVEKINCPLRGFVFFFFT